MKGTYVIFTDTAPCFEDYSGKDLFLRDTVTWLSYQGYECFWITCGDRFRIEQNYLTLIVLDNEHVLQSWLFLLKPTLMHTVDTERLTMLLKCTHLLRIPLIVGFHNWRYGIDLHPVYSTAHILENIHHHKAKADVLSALSNTYFYPYVCSDLMRIVFQRIYHLNLPMIYPSTASTVTNDYSSHRKYIVQIGLGESKGERILQSLLCDLGEIPFIVLGNPEDETRKIISAKNNVSPGSPSIIISKCHDIDLVYDQARLVIVPSIIDESFCRVVNEAMMRGIPIITTGAGNIKYLLGEAGLIVGGDKSRWKEEVANLYYHSEQLYTYSRLSKTQYILFSDKVSRAQFQVLLLSTIKKSKKYNLMLISDTLDKKDMRNTLATRFNVKQYDKAASRSTVEVKSFIIQNEIGSCVVEGVIDIQTIKCMQANNVMVYSLVDGETFNSGDILGYKSVNKTICLDWVVYEHLKNARLRNIECCIYGKKILEHRISLYDKVTYLYLEEDQYIIKAFVKYCISYPTKKVELLITSKELCTHPKISSCQKVSYNNIQAVISSKLENIHTALSQGVPVITPNQSPYNRMIKEGVNGWLYTPQDVDDLFYKFLQVTESDFALTKISTKTDYRQRFSYNRWKQSLMKAILG